MSIETEITRISTNVSETLNAVSEMGGTVPENATSNDMANGVRSIPVGAKINDSTSSPTTTYSSQKIDSEISKLNEAKANDADLAKVAKSGSYDDLTGKPTIPTVPTTLPNPYKLKLSGAVTAEYDGSREVSVEIPAGGGSGSYNLPIASSTQLGGVQPVAKTDEMTQAVGVDESGGLWALPGGGESDIVQEQAVLASGTIASGTTAGNWETGVTVGDLRKWRYFSVSFRSASNQGGPWRFQLGNKVISYGGNWCCTWLFEWIDKYVAKLHSYTNFGLMNSFFNPSGQLSMQGADVSQHFALINEADSSPVYVGSNPNLTGDLQWNVMGVLK